MAHNSTSLLPPATDATPLPPATETTPLVAGTDAPNTTASTVSVNTPPIQVQPQSLVSRWSRVVRAHVWNWRVLYLVGLFIFLVDFPSFMAEASKLRMLELALCREHYSVVDPGVIRDDGSIAEDLCKERDIQSALARMRGFLALLEYLPGLALAVPYGILADVRGRRLVAAISLFGMLLRDSWFWVVLSFYRTFPLRAVYSAPVLVIVGGGPTVLTATALAIVAADVPEDKRTQSFLYLTVTILVSEFLAPPLGSLLLNTIGPHATFISTIPVLFLSFIPIALLPSERHAKTRALDASDEADEGNGTVKTFTDIAKQRARRIVQSVRRDAALVLQRSLLLGVASLAVQRLARPMLELLLQYMSFKFGWSLSRSAFLISIQAAVQIILFVFIVPQVYGWLLKRQSDAGTANLALARLCVIFLMLGSVFMAVAPAPFVFITAMIFYTCGTGYPHAMRSFLTSLLPKNRITLLYTTMALFESLAALIASPLIGLTFSAGINLGGLAVGLPFFVAAGLYALAAVGIWLIRPERRNVV